MIWQKGKLYSGVWSILFGKYGPIAFVCVIDMSGDLLGFCWYFLREYTKRFIFRLDSLFHAWENMQE